MRSFIYHETYKRYNQEGKSQIEENFSPIRKFNTYSCQKAECKQLSFHIFVQGTNLKEKNV